MPDLKGLQIIDTGPFQAQRFGWSEPISHMKRWQNDTHDTLRIWQTQIWLGMDIMGKGDFWFRLTRESDDSLLALTNWDHYKDPTGLHSVHMDYAPNWFDLVPDDRLILVCGARRWNPVWPIVQRGHVSVTIWVTDA